MIASDLVDFRDQDSDIISEGRTPGFAALIIPLEGARQDRGTMITGCHSAGIRDRVK